MQRRLFHPLLTGSLFLCLLLGACTRKPLQKREDALRLSKTPELIADDLPMNPFLEGLEKQIAYLRSPEGKKIKELNFGKVAFPVDEYLRGLERFIELARTIPDPPGFYQAVRNQFDFYEVYGGEKWGEVLLTSYFEPIIEGSLKKTPRFSQPLYKTPTDLIAVRLDQFSLGIPNLPSLIRGRYGDKPTNSGLTQILPYYTREEIDQQGKLKNKKLEICWVDPIDAFFLQIQGSGTVVLSENQKIRVGYAEQNGKRYEAVGKYLTSVIPLEKMTLHSIEHYLRTLTQDEIQKYLNKNPSYVFFQEIKTEPITYLGTPVIAGRTIATDTRFFPKGALAYLEFKKPVFMNPSDTEAVAWEPSSRFVLDQDKGGAIQGGGRVDLFWGAGEPAKQSAGVIKEKGRLYYLAPKISQLSSTQ